MIEYILMDHISSGTNPMEAHLLKLDLEHTASHLAKAQGIVSNFENFSRLLSRSFCIFPSDLLTAYKLTQEDILSGQFLKDDTKQQSLGHCILELTSIASSHLDKVQKEFIEKPVARNSQLRPLFLPYISFRTKTRLLIKDPLILLRRKHLAPLHYPISNLINYFKASKLNKWS